MVEIAVNFELLSEMLVVVDVLVDILPIVKVNEHCIEVLRDGFPKLI